ncbi:hypothetical protein GCM10010401_03720 [Rarobacter faecitabidus]|uniref:LCP family protein n=1 Tax=Rarobacter faecitabidus TaxID=13243 RepID=UPI0031E100F4
MTDEQLPTRRSRRLQREAEQREEKLSQIAGGNAAQPGNSAGLPRTEAAQPSEAGTAPQAGGEWAPEPHTGPSSPAAAAEALPSETPAADIEAPGAGTEAPGAGTEAPGAGPFSGGVRRTSAFVTGATPVQPPSPAAFSQSSSPVPAVPGGEPPLALEPDDEPESFAHVSAWGEADGASSQLAPGGAFDTPPAFAGGDFDATPAHSEPSAIDENAAADTAAALPTDGQIPASFAPAQGEFSAAPAAAIATLNLAEEDEDRSIDAGHARVRRSHRALKAVALAVAALFVFSGAAFGAIYQRLAGNMAIEKVGGLVDDTNPASTFQPPSDPSDGKALNYLIIGVDDRSGDNGEFTNDNPGGSRSDTTMVLHISENRKRIEVVSIPRDSMVQIPACKLTGGGSTSATFGMFNSAYASGYDQGGDTASAIACVWRTVQENTGVKVDGAIMVDFAGFANVVDAINGVYMCIPEETISKDAGKLHLEAGWQTLNGKDALNYARARKGTGQNFDGSDLNRAGRQQQMVAAIFNQVTEDGILSNPTRLFSFADAVTKTLTVTETLSSTKDLAGLAYSLRGVKSKNVTLMTIPFEAYPADRNRIQWSSAATDVWQNMSEDKPLVEAETSGSAAPTTGTTTKKPTTTAPDVTKTPGREAFTAEDTTAVCDAPASKN